MKLTKYEVRCPWCGWEILPATLIPPCPRCGVYWPADIGPWVIEIGPQNAHARRLYAQRMAAYRGEEIGEFEG